MAVLEERVQAWFLRRSYARLAGNGRGAGSSSSAGLACARPPRPRSWPASPTAWPSLLAWPWPVSCRSSWPWSDSLLAVASQSEGRDPLLCWPVIDSYGEARLGAKSRASDRALRTEYPRRSPRVRRQAGVRRGCSRRRALGWDHCSERALRTRPAAPASAKAPALAGSGILPSEPCRLRVGPAIEELDAVGQDADLAPLFARRLIVPAIHLEIAFDVDPAPLPQVLTAVFGLTLPDRHVDEQGLFLALPVLTRPRPASSPSASPSPRSRWACTAIPGRTSRRPIRKTLFRVSHRHVPPQSNDGPFPLGLRREGVDSCSLRETYQILVRRSQVPDRKREASKTGRLLAHRRWESPDDNGAALTPRGGGAEDVPRPLPHGPPSSESMFGFGVIRWFIGWSTSFGWTFKISSRTTETAQVAVGDGLLELRPFRLEIREQGTFLLVPVDRVGKPAARPTAGWRRSPTRACSGCRGHA